MLDVDTDDDIFTLVIESIDRRQMQRKLERVDGIGDSIAERIVSRFGSDVPMNVDQLTDGPYVGDDKAQAIIDHED